MFKSIHFKALAVWIFYSVVTKALFISGIFKSVNMTEAFTVNILLNSFFGVLFLYFFSHEDFFKFAGEIEKKNIKKEKIWERYLANYGKLFSALIIGVIAGPLVGALSVRLLIPKHKLKYLVVVLSSALSATIWLGIARGIIPLKFPF